jgi:hypothetical protein
VTVLSETVPCHNRTPDNIPVNACTSSLERSQKQLACTAISIIRTTIVFVLTVSHIPVLLNTLWTGALNTVWCMSSSGQGSSGQEPEARTGALQLARSKASTVCSHKMVTDDVACSGCPPWPRFRFVSCLCISEWRRRLLQNRDVSTRLTALLAITATGYSVTDPATTTTSTTSLKPRSMVSKTLTDPTKDDRGKTDMAITRLMFDEVCRSVTASASPCPQPPIGHARPATGA